MSRNSVDYFSHVPTPTMPRYKRDLGVHKKTMTLKHGRLTPWYTRLVYPHSNLKMDMSAFIRMDTSAKVPLDDIFLDNYFFFVPLRIILGNEKFEKILGHKTAYDTNTYNFPIIHLQNATSTGSSTTFNMNHDSLIQYMNYGAITGADTQYGTQWNSVNGSGVATNYSMINGVDEFISALNLAAYYIVYNQYFRDENLDPEIPVDDLLAGDVYLSDLENANSGLWRNFETLPVNRYHDMFSSGLISPVKGGNGDVTIPLGFGSLPVITGDSHTISTSNLSWSDINGTTIPSGRYPIWSTSGSITNFDSANPNLTGAYQVVPNNLWADASAATGPSVRQLYNSLALFSLYDKRGTFGTRLIEQIRGSFGLEVPDGLLDRAEYLGGSNQSLNNIPVLNTTSNDSGSMVGNSATITGFNSFDKGFNEWGIVIGLSVTRIKHIYPQGIADPTWLLFDNLDLYWPEFANIGKVGLLKDRIANTNSRVGGEIFNYVDPYIDQETEIDTTAGDFGPFRAGSDDLANYWTYQDLYATTPTFNANWLKEDNARIAGTLTSTLIPYASSEYGHQFMIRYNWHSQLTLAKPLHPHAPNITGRI